MKDGHHHKITSYDVSSILSSEKTLNHSGCGISTQSSTADSSLNVEHIPIMVSPKVEDSNKGLLNPALTQSSTGSTEKDDLSTSGYHDETFSSRSNSPIEFSNFEILKERNAEVSSPGETRKRTRLAFSIDKIMEPSPKKTKVRLVSVNYMLEI